MSFRGRFILLIEKRRI